MQLFVTTGILLTLAFLATPGEAKPRGYGYGRYHFERQLYRQPFEKEDIAYGDEQPMKNKLNEMPWVMTIEDASDYGDEDDNADSSTTIHTNTFTLKMSGLSNLKFDEEDHSITSGQPWQGLTTKCSPGECALNIKAGRKGSSAVANWFKDAVGGGSAIACDSYDTYPSSLNFGIKGTMTFDHGGNTYVGKDFVIAQGHNARSRNNWWIGGPNLATIAIQPGILAAAAQTFHYGLAGVLPAKVAFTAAIGCVSNMQMGIIQI